MIHSRLLQFHPKLIAEGDDMTKPAVARWRSIGIEVYILLIGFFAMNMGYFMVVPLLTVYMKSQLGLPALAVGGVMALSVGLQKGLTFLGGLLADRFERRSVLLVGLGLRVAGYALFAFVRDMPELVAAALLSSVGGALFGPPIRAALAQAASPENRQVVFAGRQIANNLGATLGPMAGAALALWDTRFAFLLGSITHVLLIIMVVLFVPRLGMQQARQVTFRELLRTMAVDRSLWLFCAMTILFTLIYSQLTITLPLRALALSPGGDAGNTATGAAVAASLFTVNGVGAIVLQFLWLPVAKRVPALTSFGWGSLLCGLGLLGAGMAPSLVYLYAAVLVFTLGEVLTMPALDTVIAEIAPPEAMGSYYGIFNLAWAVGSSLGNTFGGWLSDRLKDEVGQAAILSVQTGLYWGLFLGLGMVLLVASGQLRRLSTARSTPPDSTGVMMMR
jgi:DHA1 family multidrug resistance protein-like MFS transporter